MRISSWVLTFYYSMHFFLRGIKIPCVPFGQSPKRNQKCFSGCALVTQAGTCPVRPLAQTSRLCVA
jgi:hypothetical protein